VNADLAPLVARYRELVREELLSDDVDPAGRRLRAAPRLFDDTAGEGGRHEEAHLVARGAHVDAYEGAPLREGGSAAHAGVQRARQVEPLVERVLEQPVVRSLDDAQAEVERVAHRVQAGALDRGRPGERDHHARARRPAYDREVVDRIDSLEAHRLGPALPVDALDRELISTLVAVVNAPAITGRGLVAGTYQDTMTVTLSAL